METCRNKTIYKIVECCCIKAFCKDYLSQELRIFISDSLDKAISFLRQKISKTISKDDFVFTDKDKACLANSFESKFINELDIREIYIYKEKILKHKNKYAKITFYKHNEITKIS